MPSTHLSLHYHLIFSTKDRVPHLHKDWQGRLHAYLGGIISDMRGVPETIGGMEDHVHLLVGLRATHRLADVLRELKSASSKWVHDEMKKPLFSWQDGYAAFTVSASRIEVVKNYIAKQEEHHRRKTFQEEYLEFLNESGIEYARSTFGEKTVQRPARARPESATIPEIPSPANFQRPSGTKTLTDWLALATALLTVLLVLKSEVCSQDATPSSTPAPREQAPDKAKSRSEDTSKVAAASTAPTPATDFWTREEMTGEWGGTRSRWKDKDVELEFSLTQFYQGVVFFNIAQIGPLTVLRQVPLITNVVSFAYVRQGPNVGGCVTMFSNP